PIRAFTDGMARLAEVLSPDERADLGRRLAERVTGAAAGLQVVVVSSAPEVRVWADARSLACIDDPGSLDDAAAAGVAWCAARGHARAVVLHADLPRVHATSIDALTRDAGTPIVAIVPCRRGDGTPAISVPTAAGFTFAYGPGSVRRHTRHAHAAGLGVRTVRDPDLAADLDLPEDLAAEGLGPGGTLGGPATRMHATR
ncbi:MAG: 2-phospho-L-lactate guanylyltransferase, partial [Actinomycetota bacterium]